MQINSFAPVYIFALNYEGRSDNEAAELYDIASIAGQTPGQAAGYWEGTEERSYILPSDVINKEREQFVELWEFTDQDAVLFLDNQRVAYLYKREDGYRHGPGTEILGVFKEVNPTLVSTLQGWTKIGDTYFSAR